MGLPLSDLELVLQALAALDFLHKMELVVSLTSQGC